MKFKKTTSLIAMGAVVASMGLVSVACGGKNDPPPPPKDAEISYQFTGHYTDDTLKSMGFDYYILLNLYDDGSVKGSGYNQLAMDSSAYAVNKAFSEKWYKGSWKDAKNDEDMDYIDLNVKYDTDAVNMQTGQQLIGDFKYELYADAQGNIKFTVDVPFASGRKQEINGGKTVRYKTLDEFIQGNLYTWTAPENIAVFKSEEPNAVANIYCQANGDALFYTGTKDPAKNEYKYISAETWKWTQSGGTVSFKKGGDPIGSAAVTDGKASFDYEKDSRYYKQSFKFSCADASELLKSSGAQEEEAQPVVTFTSEDNASLKVFEDNTAVLSAFGGMLKPEFTWAVDNGSIVFTDKEDNSKKYTATVSGTAATVVYSDTLMGNPINITLTCADVSAILNAAPLAEFTATSQLGAGKIELFADKSAKGSIGTMINLDWTWKVESGKIVFTDKSDTTKTYDATITGNSASLEYAPSFLQGATVAFSCADVSKLLA